MQLFDTRRLDSDGLVVIVGGSGFIGRYLVQELAPTAVRMRIVVRNEVAAQFLKPLGGLGQIDIVSGDVTSPASLARAFRDATLAVNLVGILDESGQTFNSVQNRGAAAVAQAAADVGIDGFVHVSAIGASSASPARYARSKAEGEAAVRQLVPHATVMRPSVIFGPEDGFLNRFAGLARSLPVMPVIAGATRLQPVYVRDVAQSIVAALADRENYGGKIFELGGPRVYTMRALIQWIMREVRADKPLFELPSVLAKVMAKLGDFVPGAPLTFDQWLMLQSDNVATQPGLAELGIDPTPMEAIAPGYLERFRTAGRFHRDSVA